MVDQSSHRLVHWKRTHACRQPGKAIALVCAVYIDRSPEIVEFLLRLRLSAHRLAMHREMRADPKTIMGFGKIGAHRITATAIVYCIHYSLTCGH